MFNDTFSMLRICCLVITSPETLVSIAMSFPFFIKLSSKRFGIPALLKTKSLYGFFFLNLFFDEFTLVRFKVCSSNFEVNFFTDEAVPKLFKNYSNLTADFFWDSFLIIHKKHHRLLHLQDSTPHSKYGLLQKY